MPAGIAVEDMARNPLKRAPGAHRICSVMKRRRFLGSSAAASLGFQFIPRRVLGASAEGVAPNDKLRIAAIGSGGRGLANLKAMRGEDIVALCDVDAGRAAESHGMFPGAERFQDFRVMFDKMSDRIDAVLVATPDHTHFTATMHAIARGKHVYCEKPLAHSIGQVRAMRRAARDRKVITQVGNQGHSTESIRVFCELIQGGAIGDITGVQAGYKGSYCKIGSVPDLRAGKKTPPAGFDWKLWQGPVAHRPYHPAYAPGSWRGFSAFGTGSIGDWVCHVLDPVFWAAQLAMPTAITAETEGWDPAKDPDYFPRGSRITFEFPARGARPAFPIVWNEGSFQIPRPAELDPGSKIVGTGAVVRGTQGAIMYGSHGAGGLRVLPRKRHEEIAAQGIEKTIPRVQGSHQQDWMSAIREGRPAGSDFDYGGALTEIALLGIIAMQFPGTRLEWDAPAMQFRDHAAASALVRHALHNGWQV